MEFYTFRICYLISDRFCRVLFIPLSLLISVHIPKGEVGAVGGDNFQKAVKKHHRSPPSHQDTKKTLAEGRRDQLAIKNAKNTTKTPRKNWQTGKIRRRQSKRSNENRETSKVKGSHNPHSDHYEPLKGPSTLPMIYHCEQQSAPLGGFHYRSVPF